MARTLVALLLIFVFAVAGAGEPGRRQEQTGKAEYVVGITPQFEANKLFAIWRPILDALEKETGLAFTLRGAPVLNEFEQQYNAGMFDFVYANPYFVGVRNRQGYLPLIRDHGSSLSGIVVVRKDSPIQNVRELVGQTVAFPSANALAGCLLIRAELEDEFGVKVAPRFVRTHDSSFLNVALGTTVAGGGVQATLEKQRPEVRDNLRILYKTKDMVTLPFVAHPRVPEEVRRRVQAAFLKLGDAPAGQALLAQVPIKRIGTAVPAEYEALRQLHLDRYEN